MQTLSADEYAFLAELANAYRDVHLPEIKQTGEWNPRLGVDALCFQKLCFQHHGVEHMVGALITPSELWLVAVPNQTQLTDPLADTLTLALPSGHYRLSLERLVSGYELYKRIILHDLGELDSMQEATRLAQRMMARLMQPSDESDT